MLGGLQLKYMSTEKVNIRKCKTASKGEIKCQNWMESSKPDCEHTDVCKEG